MIKFLGKYYYKTKIIVTFAIISIVMVLITSRASYYFVKDLYLQQIEEQINLISEVLSEDLETNMITLLDLGTPTKSLNNYFRTQLTRRSFDELQSEIFIFSSTLEIPYSSKKDYLSTQLQDLSLYKNDIQDLEINSRFTSTPFVGIDGQWYLYNFSRIGNNTFLGIKAHAASFSRIEEFDNLFWMIGGIAILLIIVFSWFLANSITRPVNKLVNFSKLVGDNKFDTNIPGGMKGELQILAKAMDMMRNNILRNQKERESMLAQIAHEIRNPLGGIELLAGLTKEDLLKNNLPYHYQEKILKEVSGLKTLITSYLNYSKPAPANPDNVDISQIINDVKSSLYVKVNRKGIEITEDLKLTRIRFDKDQLKHILMNLMINSIDAVGNSGKIEISSYSINGSAIIHVSDNGEGIPEESKNKIFQPFFTTKKEGIGLGLAISQKYCFENNSDIVFESNESGGTSVKIIKEV